MKHYLIFFISMIVSEVILMIIFIKIGWNKQLWQTISRKINKRYFVFLWLLALVIAQILLQVILSLFNLSMSVQQLIQGIFLGAFIALSPIYIMDK